MEELMILKEVGAQLIEYIDPWSNCTIHNCCSPLLVGTWGPHKTGEADVIIPAMYEDGLS